MAAVSQILTWAVTKTIAKHAQAQTKTREKHHLSSGCHIGGQAVDQVSGIPGGWQTGCRGTKTSINPMTIKD
ncbi:hypothetical protein ACO0LL_27425 [Undibacterium sp. TC4M20W]|uniref:hypothetical protein n=1 Tax=Undibacterium sp. TC4M20W TaxID=3413052 RepID=UPI003BF1D1BC